MNILGQILVNYSWDQIYDIVFEELNMNGSGNITMKKHFSSMSLVPSLQSHSLLRINNPFERRESKDTRHVYGYSYHKDGQTASLFSIDPLVMERTETTGTFVGRSTIRLKSSKT